MNSSINSSESNSASNQQQTNMQAIEAQDLSTHAASTEANSPSWQRLQPIPPPSEPMQYRAIGLVRGRYIASSEQFTQGTLQTEGGTQVISAVLLGRIISLLKNHIDLEQEHLWVVYPRTGQKEDNLHLQIVGVWEPEKLTKQQTESDAPTTETSKDISLSQEVVNNYFSVRGEVVYQSSAEGHFIVKIRQVPRPEVDKPKYFKLKILGDLATKAVGQFWNLQVERQADTLVLATGEVIAALPSSKPKPKKQPDNASTRGTRRIEPPQPVRKTSLAPPIKQPARSPAPKPIKRPPQ